jgi:hypothetical protein
MTSIGFKKVFRLFAEVGFLHLFIVQQFFRLTFQLASQMVGRTKRPFTAWTTRPGRRLRAAGVTEEDRKALLGHKNGSITSHYSAAELDQLIAAANKVSVTDSRAPALTILKRRQI